MPRWVLFLFILKMNQLCKDRMSKPECREVNPPQRGRCKECRQWMSEAERAAGMELGGTCYTQLRHELPAGT